MPRREHHAVVAVKGQVALVGAHGSLVGERAQVGTAVLDVSQVDYRTEIAQVVVGRLEVVAAVDIDVGSAHAGLAVILVHHVDGDHVVGVVERILSTRCKCDQARQCKCNSPIASAHRGNSFIGAACMCCTLLVMNDSIVRLKLVFDAKCGHALCPVFQYLHPLFGIK